MGTPDSPPEGTRVGQGRYGRSGFRWLTVALATLAIGLLLVAVVPNPAAAVSTYTVTLREVGLPAATYWTATFNGVVVNTNLGTATFTGVAAGTWSWSITTPVAGTTGVQYVATNYYGSMTVPNQVSQWVVFQKQYQVSFASTPSTDGSTSPSSTTWYNAGTSFVVSALPNVGYTFSSWSSSAGLLTFGNVHAASTMVTVGAPGTVTANFASTVYTVTFSEVGLPSGAIWSVVFNSATNYGTAPASIAITSVPVGSYSWSAGPVSAGTGTEYAPAVYGGSTSGTISPPYQTLQVIVFTKQFQVQFAVSGSGSTTPSSSTYYMNNTILPIAAISSTGTVFSKWASSGAQLLLASTSAASTTATVTGPGTLTATFVAGTPCTVCTVTFKELGLPTGTGWGVYFNGSYYTSTSPTITIAKQGSGDYYWLPVNAIAVGSMYVSYAVAPTYGYMYVPYQTLQQVVYTKQVFLQFQNVPFYYAAVYTNYGPGCTTVSYSASGIWCAPGSQLSIWTYPGSLYYLFSHWTANTTTLLFAKTTAAATSVTIGGPATIAANWVQPVRTVTFVAYKLPLATTWGVTFAGVTYWTNATALTLKGITMGSWYWSVVTPLTGGANGVQFVPTQSSGYMTMTTQLYQAIVFVKQFWVTFVATPSGHGSVNPSGSGWYANGTYMAISAIYASGSFSSWSSSSTLITITNTAAAATLATIRGTGIVTATFT